MSRQACNLIVLYLSPAEVDRGQLHQHPTCFGNDKTLAGAIWWGPSLCFFTLPIQKPQHV